MFDVWLTQWWKGLLTVVTWPTTWGVNHQRNTPKHTGLFVFQSHFQCLRIYFYVSIGFSIRKSRGGCGKGWNPSSLKSSVWFPHSHSDGFLSAMSSAPVYQPFSRRFQNLSCMFLLTNPMNIPISLSSRTLWVSLTLSLHCVPSLGATDFSLFDLNKVEKPDQAIKMNFEPLLKKTGFL